jgi:hypothetical protein
MSLTQVQVKLVSPNDLVDPYGRMSKAKEGSVNTFKGEDILNALRHSKRLVKNDDGEEVFRLQFDAQHFEFKVGEEMTVPENVAWGFRNDSRVFVDPKDPLGSPYPCAIVEVERWMPGMSKPVAKQTFKPLPKTLCPECGKDQGTLAKLAEHLMDVHCETGAEV